MAQQLLKDQSDTGLGGVNYVEENKCPVGHTRNGEKCQQVCTHCTYEDEKGYFGDKIPSSDICGITGVFDGIDYNGFVKCKMNPYLQNNQKNNQNVVYNADSTFNKILSFIN